MWIIRSGIILIIFLMLLGFSFENNYQLTTVNLLGKQYEGLPLMIVVFVSFAAGVIFWFIVSVFQYFRITGQMNEFKRKNKQLLEEIKALRNLPLDEVSPQDMLPSSRKE